jgi:hypothetical protein
MLLTIPSYRTATSVAEFSTMVGVEVHATSARSPDKRAILCIMPAPKKEINNAEKVAIVIATLEQPRYDP